MNNYIDKINSDIFHVKNVYNNRNCFGSLCNKLTFVIGSLRIKLQQSNSILGFSIPYMLVFNYAFLYIFHPFVLNVIFHEIYKRKDEYLNYDVTIVTRMRIPRCWEGFIILDYFIHLLQISNNIINGIGFIRHKNVNVFNLILYIVQIHLLL